MGAVLIVLGEKSKKLFLFLIPALVILLALLILLLVRNRPPRQITHPAVWLSQSRREVVGRDEITVGGIDRLDALASTPELNPSPFTLHFSPQEGAPPLAPPDVSLVDYWWVASSKPSRTNPVTALITAAGFRPSEANPATDEPYAGGAGIMVAAPDFSQIVIYSFRDSDIFMCAPAATVEEAWDIVAALGLQDEDGSLRPFDQFVVIQPPVSAS